VLWNTLDRDLDGNVTADELPCALGPRALDPLRAEAGAPIALDEHELPETCASADRAYTTNGVVLASEVHHEARIKIMVMDAAIRNQDRFVGRRTLVLTGERAQESTARKDYAVFEPHRTDLRHGQHPRWVDHWRPVHGWDERKVWALIEKYRINPHPAYRLGWGRVSCAGCIFGSRNQWASLRVANRPQFERIATYERAFGKTIDQRLSIAQMADRGLPFDMRDEDLRAALSTTFDEPVFLDPWTLPRGALHGDACGPT
jgi:3'-phosphoadenosine 5'-phosphosulfate sulfotransferase (PAPS reductase)/FAD synthetase